MTNNKLFLLLGTSLSLLPSLTSAQCIATQDCATLGYTESSCNGGKGVKCPFGNWWACLVDEQDICRKNGFTEECKGAGQIPGGDGCGGLYKQCACDSNYQYTCTGTGYAGGSGAACNGKYTSCTCASGYEWKNGTCQQKILNGAIGNLYYCNNKVVGVKTSDMSFYIAMKDLGALLWGTGNSQCNNYVFCNTLKGILPRNDHLTKIYNNKSTLNTLLTSNGGSKLTESSYWSYNADYSGGSTTHCSIDLSYGSISCNWGHEDTTKRYVRPVLTSW